jgi:hypothetical protein
MLLPHRNGDAKLSRTEEKLVEMSNGCICCTLRDDLLKEVRALAHAGRFDNLLIESTGISEPMPQDRWPDEPEWHRNGAGPQSLAAQIRRSFSGLEKTDELSRSRAYAISNVGRNPKDAFSPAGGP